MTRLTACLVLLAVLVGLPAARAQEPPRLGFVRIRVGFEHRYKVGQWTPVDVTLRGGAESVTGVVTLSCEDNDGTLTRVGAEATSSNICQVLPGAETTVRMYVKFGQVEGALMAALHEPVQVNGRTMAGKVIVRKRFESGYERDETHFLPALPATDELIVTVGPGSVGVEEAINVAGASQADALMQGSVSDSGSVGVRIDDVDQLPTRWYGYEGVDAVVMATSVPEMFRKLTADGARVEALQQWVRSGGLLVLTVGAQADEMLAKDAPLARFAPGRLEEVITLRSTAALETYSGASTPVPGGPASTLRVPRLVDVEGRIEASDSDLPLVVRRAMGLGQVVFVAADLERPPFAKWPGRGRLVGKLLGMGSGRSAGASNDINMLRHGYNDLSGQLRSQLDNYTDVKMVPFWVVAGLILLYILLIGPGDYFFLRKVVGRMQWTWVTFPVIVVAVSVGAYGLAYWLKGDQLRLNQVDLVDVDAVDHEVYGTTWMNIFSPRSDTYDLTFRPLLPDGQAATDPGLITSWMGLPGDWIGGMQSQAASPQLWSRGYDFTAHLHAMQGVPIQVWSTKSITARWRAPCVVYPKAELTEEDGLPEGTITNTLDFPLTNCLLAVGRWGYSLGTIEPGATRKIEPMSRDRVELRTLLSGRVVEISDDEIVHSMPQRYQDYRTDSSDIPQTLRTMMFFDVLGGGRQQSLMNRYQRFVDLSGLLKTDRAILMAEAGGGSLDKQRHGAVALRDGQPMARPGDQHTVMYRFIYPLKPKTGR